jgi:hypothetical protein
LFALAEGDSTDSSNGTFSGRQFQLSQGPMLAGGHIIEVVFSRMKVIKNPSQPELSGAVILPGKWPENVFSLKTNK